MNSEVLFASRDVIEPCDPKVSSNGVSFDCPGCGQKHSVNLHPDNGKPWWVLSGSMARPTIEPSVNVEWSYGPSRNKKLCHFRIRDGRIEFCNDSTHAYAGKTVDMFVIAER